MKVSVYCSSAPDLDPALIDFAYELGKGIARAGHDLVWGGAKVSMMGAVARRYLSFHNKPIAILDPIGAYGPLKSALEHLASHNLMKSGQNELISWTTRVDEALDALAAHSR